MFSPSSVAAAMCAPCSPKELRKTTVECLVIVPASGKEGTQLWCGLGSGSVQVVDVGSKKCESRYDFHTQVGGQT